MIEAFPKLDVRYQQNLFTQFPNDEFKMVVLDDDEDKKQIDIKDVENDSK